MTLVALRILRLSMIILKEFTQPVKGLFVNISKRSGFFRRYICKPPAHFYNWCEHQLHLLLNKDKTFEPLNEEEAINLGSAIWAEIVVFIGCSKVLILEMNRKTKEDSRARVMKNTDEDLAEAVNILQRRLKQQYFYLEKIVKALEELVYHWCDVTIKMLLLNLGRPVKVEPLNEGMAIELGAEILGELIVFLIAATALLIETTRQLKNKNVRESVNVHHIDLIEAMRVLEFRQERQKAYMQEITRALGELGKPIKLKKVIERKDFQEKHDKLFKHKL